MNIVLEHFNELANSYDEKSLNRISYLNSIDNLIINTLIEKDYKLLDIGCGTGKRTKELKLKLSLSEVYGCDISPNMIDMAKRNIENVIFQDMSDLTYNDKEFDVLTCLFNSFGCLNTKKKRFATLKHFNRVLKDDGILFIDVMNFCLLARPFKGNGDKFFKLNIEDKEVEGYVHGFTHNEMKKLLKESGFKYNKFIVGYDDGKLHRDNTKGQLFYICKKELS
jgi:ubiquinone/menaquinone biosynthesis C-methylase UbiE